MPATHYTAAQAATQLGCDSRTVRRVAQRLGIGNKITERMWLISDEDLRKIAAVIQATPGRPKNPVMKD